MAFRRCASLQLVAKHCDYDTHANTHIHTRARARARANTHTHTYTHYAPSRKKRCMRASQELSTYTICSEGMDQQSTRRLLQPY
eukprot:4023598-Pleurochrysis_carterae.AAC.1